MPIPREAFEQGLDEVDQKICRFLEEHQDMAYTMEEIASAVGIVFSNDVSGMVRAISFGLRLDKLAQKGYVHARSTGGGLYYAWRKPK